MGLPKNIERDFSENKLPISDEKINKWLYGLINDSYNSSIDVFSDDITKFDKVTIKNKLSKLITLAQKIELQFRDELEKLCAESVLALFSDVKYGKIECTLVDNCINHTFNVNPTIPDNVRYNTMSDVNNESLLKLKRKYTSLLTVGAAQYIADKILFEISDELAQYDKNLPYLYEKILKINNYLSFLSDEEITDKNNLQGAYETVNIGESESGITIESKGIIFPFLLIETVRAFIEVISTKHISDTEKNLIEQCDILSDEPWNYRIGETFFKRFIGNEEDINVIPIYLDKVFSLKSKRFIGLMLNAVVNTVEFEIKTKSLIDRIIHSIEYNEFEKHLDAKRNEKDLITDEYYDACDLM